LKNNLNSSITYSEDYYIQQYTTDGTDVNLVYESDNSDSKLNNYFSVILQNMIDPSTEDLNSNFNQIGRVGSYTGSGQSIHLSLPHINDKIMNALFDILKREQYLFYSNSLRGAYMTMTYFHYPDQFFYYVNVLFEFNTFGKVSIPRINVTPFNLNIYYDKTGKILLVLDIIRLVLSFFLALMALKNLKDNFDLKKGTQASVADYVLTVINPFFSLIFVSFILYLIVFIKKMSSLNQNLSTVFSIKKGVYDFKELNKNDYGNIAYDYEFVVMLDTLIIYLLFARICLVFSDFTRIKMFFSYMKISIINSFTFICIISLIFVSFAVFANNLFGDEKDNFRDFGASLMSVILITIGHFRLIDTEKNKVDYIWKNFFLTLYIFIVVYLFLSTFIGIFLDSFRIAILRDRSTYSSRLLNIYIERKDEKSEIEESKQ
jgi:hypothetical protein